MGRDDIVRRACGLVERLVIGIGIHPGKTPLFTVAERSEMLRAVCDPIAAESGTTLVIETFGDLAVQAARRLEAAVLIRGLRDGAGSRKPTDSASQPGSCNCADIVQTLDQ